MSIISYGEGDKVHAGPRKERLGRQPTAALALAAVRWHNGTMIRSVTADAARADRTPPADPGFGVYVHWPFCLSKCP